MNPLYIMTFVSEGFVLGWMWHNQSARPEIESESTRSDPAVLFSRSRPNFRKSSPPKQVPTILESPSDKQQIKVSTILEQQSENSKKHINGYQPLIPLQLPPSEEQNRQRAHDISVARGGPEGMALKDRLQTEREIKHPLYL